MLPDLRRVVEIKRAALHGQRARRFVQHVLLLVSIHEVTALAVHIETANCLEVSAVIRVQHKVIARDRCRAAKARNLVALIELKARQCAEAAVLKDILHLVRARIACRRVGVRIFLKAEALAARKARLLVGIHIIREAVQLLRAVLIDVIALRRVEEALCHRLRILVQRLNLIENQRVGQEIVVKDHAAVHILAAAAAAAALLAGDGTRRCTRDRIDLDRLTSRALLCLQLGLAVLFL